VLLQAFQGLVGFIQVLCLLLSFQFLLTVQHFQFRLGPLKFHGHIVAGFDQHFEFIIGVSDHRFIHTSQGVYYLSPKETLNKSQHSS